jgi:uncharacterized membrane protein
MNAAICVAAVVACGPAVAQPLYNIIDIGVAPGDNYSEGLSISPGGVATGRSLLSTSAYPQLATAFSWTQAGGYMSLPNLTTTPSRPFDRGRGANDFGVVVGWGEANDFSIGPLPVIWQGGVASQLPLPTGQTRGRAYAINNSGVVVGAVGPNESQVGAIYSGGTASIITQLTADGAPCSFALGINNAGRIVGSGFNPSTGNGVGYVLDTSTNTAFSVGVLPGRDGSTNYGVSNAGHVVGYSFFTHGSPMPLPYVWTDGGGMVAIPIVAGTDRAYALGVNSLGWVVGYGQNVFSPGAAAVPFLYDGTSTYRLGDLIPADSGWNLLTDLASYAYGISDNGTIIGTAGFNGEEHAFAMIPVAVPEPGTFGLASVAAVVAAVWRRVIRGNRTE